VQVCNSESRLERGYLCYSARLDGWLDLLVFEFGEEERDSNTLPNQFGLGVKTDGRAALLKLGDESGNCTLKNGDQYADVQNEQKSGSLRSCAFAWFVFLLRPRTGAGCHLECPSRHQFFGLPHLPVGELRQRPPERHPGLRNQTGHQ